MDTLDEVAEQIAREAGDAWTVIYFSGQDRRRQQTREQQEALLDAKLAQARASILRQWERLDEEG
jgi:hypothetical protein